MFWVQSLCATFLAISFLYLHVLVQCCKKKPSTQKREKDVSTGINNIQPANPVQNERIEPLKMGETSPAHNPKKEDSIKSMKTQQSSRKSQKSEKSRKNNKSKSHKDTDSRVSDGKENSKKEEDDSFNRRRPKVMEAIRTNEIKAKGTVARERDDYKTMKGGMPTSDFEKSLNLPKDNE